MRLNKDIQEVVTQELLAYFNSSSSTDRPNLGHRVIAEFSKNVSVAVVSYINSHNVKISTGTFE
ncbi:hypothetical protein EON65_23825 [archaeon]|nr:MAG: hypothetical protein EON65_23825 [archaeon]